MFDSDINNTTVTHLHEEKKKKKKATRLPARLKQSQSKAEAVISHFFFGRPLGAFDFQRPPLASDIIRGRASI